MEKRTEYYDITIDSSFLAAFRDMPMEMYKVFREFIDNALQSYLDHSNELNALPDSKRKCCVDIIWDSKEIIIDDNAWGMGEPEFKRALKLSSKAPEAAKDDRLSRFGIGLKTAACYASSDYIIDSRAYGSGLRYKTEMDIDYINDCSPEKNEVTITNCGPFEHGTTIRLKKLNPNCSFSNVLLKKVREKLEKIYDKYIESGELLIRINKENLVSREPEMFTDEKNDFGWNGSEVMYSFSNLEGFEFEGKKYRYEGWVGMMKEGDASGNRSGFNYYQAKRAIVLSDHPKKLFGSSNDYRYQRVVGNINLLGNNWPITFNKDGIQWGDQGLLSRFIEDIEKDPQIKKVFNTALKYRARKAEDSADKLISGLGQDIKTPESSIDNGQRKPKVNTNDGKSNDVSQKGSEPPIQKVQKEVKTTEATAHFSYLDKTYEMTLTIISNDPDADWIKMRDYKEDGDLISCSVEINLDTPWLKELTQSTTQRRLLIKMAEAFVVSRIISVKQGLRLNQSNVLENSINDVLRKAK